MQEAVQVDSRPLKSGRAPCEASPRHSVVFLLHRFLVPSNFCLALCRDAGSSLSVRPPRAAIEWWSLSPSRGLRRRGFRGALPQHEKRHGIDRRSVTHFGCSLGYSRTHQEHKKSANPHQAAETSVEIFAFGRSLFRTSTLAGQGTLPSPTAGCQIRFPESLLMLS